MKIAITDYDGTLRDLKSGVVPQSNVEAIQKWRKAGNKFGIATGRNISMLDFELKNYDITLDFVVCVNGAVVLDKERNILHSVRIPSSIVEEFIKLPIVKDANNQIIVFCERELFAIRPYSEIPIELVPKISFEELLKRDDVVQIGIKFKTAEEALKMKEDLPKIFPMLGGNPNRNYLDINMSGVNKKYGISQLLKVMSWQDCSLFVIGDDSNDLPMIEEYKGYTVKTAAPFMHKATAKVYDSVGDMLIENI